VITLSGFQPRAKRARKKITIYSAKNSKMHWKIAIFHRILGSQILARNKTAQKHLEIFWPEIKPPNKHLAVWTLRGVLKATPR